jgi:hypothetical protein
MTERIAIATIFIIWIVGLGMYGILRGIEAITKKGK